MRKIRQNKGITLVALVITIVILLILAGITIASFTGSGLFGHAKDAAERTIKAQLKEEIQLAIQEIQIEELPKGNNVTLESLADGQLVAKLIEITADLGTNEITGEYKNYDYTIDSNLKVEIGGKIGGVKPTGTAEILTTGYIFEGDGTVEIKITASITEGTITKIEALNGATLTTDTSATEKTFTVTQNGTYIFKILGDSGRSVNVVANVENILETPQITITENAGGSFKINVENNYPEGAIIEYKYYVANKIVNQGTTNKYYVVTGLIEDTEYSNIKVIAYIDSNTSKESNKEKVTVRGAWSEEYRTTSDYTDAYGNVAKIPEGFQVSTKQGQTNINEGLVVRNATDKNEFVWIPVGKIYTDVKRTEENSKTIEFNRYTFDSNGNPTAQNESLISSEYAEEWYDYNKAKNILAFKVSVQNNNGYYIGRYEARKGENGTITEIGSDKVWKNMTFYEADTAAKKMYDTQIYESDLINSYAWDTAIFFLQKCGTDSKYSIKSAISGSIAETGTNNQINKDVQCNIYDMASNFFELTTEATTADLSYCVSRGDSYGDRYKSTSRRDKIKRNVYHSYASFRPILYFYEDYADYADLNVTCRKSFSSDGYKDGCVPENAINDSLANGKGYNWYGGTKLLIEYDNLYTLTHIGVYTTDNWGTSFTTATIYYSEDDSLTLDSDLSNFKSITISTGATKEISKIKAKRVMLTKGTNNAVYEFRCFGY